MRRPINFVLAAAALSLSIPLSANAEEPVGNILFGRPLEPGINVVWLNTDSRNDQRAPANYRDPSAAVRASAQSELVADPTLRDFIERRNIRPHNVLAIQTAASGAKILYAR